MSTPTDERPKVEEFDLLTSPINPGLTVIEASAGTGKTYSISHLVPRLLINGTLSKLSEFLLVTFTNDAARELAERARLVLVRLSQPPDEGEMAAPDGHLARLRRELASQEGAPARLAAALRDLDQLAVSTIHSFCQRTLQQEGALCGLPVMPDLTTDDADQLEVMLREAWLEQLSARPRLAALAAGDEWQLHDAAGFIRAFRTGENAGGATSHPPPGDLDSLLEQIRERSSRLTRSTANWNEVHALLAGEGVVFTTAALGSVEGIVAQIDCVLSGQLESPVFWHQLNAAATLSDFVNGVRSRAVKGQVAASAWVTEAKATLGLVQGLKWSWHHFLAGYVLPKLAEQTKKRRLITQDGLVATLHAALTGGGDPSRALARRLAGRFKVGLIDESQDTDPRQLAIFEAIFLRERTDGRLLLIGDPKQAIYRFRGADLSTYLQARRRARCHYSLTQTFRAPERLVRAQNAIFSRPGAFHHPEMRFTAAKSGLKSERTLMVKGKPAAPVQVWLADSDRKDLSSGDRRIRTFGGCIADTVIELIQQGAEIRSEEGDEVTARAVRLDDFAVLLRSNRQAAKMADVLEERGVPVILNSGASVFASDEATELRDVLHAVLEPARTVRLRWALATRLLGLNAEDLRAFDEQHAAEDRWRQLFSQWQGIWQRQGLAALWAALDTPGEALPVGVSQRLAQQAPGGERRATNYRQLTDLLLEAGRDQFPRPADLLRWLHQRISTADETDVPDEHQIQLASEANAVRVLTMHKSKGLEYPLVFCPTLVEPLRKPDTAQGITVGATRMLANLSQLGATDPAHDAVLHADLEENLRLVYVGLTRAQIGVWITSYSAKPGSSSFSAGPLDWILRPREEQAVHPTCSAEWMKRAADDRSNRHRGALAEMKEAGIETRPVPAPLNRHWQSGPTAATGDGDRKLRALDAPALPSAWTVTSFSRLTQKADAAHLPSDKSDVVSTADSAESIGPGNPAIAQAETGTAPAINFIRAARGASVGTAVHDWLQDWDFQPLAPPGVEPTPLARHLARAGLPQPKEGQPEWESCLGELCTVLRDVRLPCRDSWSPPLHQVTPDPGSSEWNFDLPLRDWQQFPDSLVACFQHSTDEDAAYATALAELPPSSVSGLLTGFIDRVVCIDGAWGVIDWKTNWLGDEPSAYQEASLRAYAYSSHYWLQMHLYLVALRRWRRSVGDDTPVLAGAWLVFLRGIEANTSRGVLAVRPSEGLLDALEELFISLPDQRASCVGQPVRP